jgi:hypothetical protein
MGNGHLDDQRIQDFLDGHAADAGAVRRHLDACASCRQLAEEYRELFGMLAAEPSYRPAVDLADRVMNRVADRRRVFSSSIVCRLLIVAAAVAALAIPFLFANPRSLHSSVKGLAAAGSSVVASLAASLRIVAGWMNNGTPLLLSAAVVFVFIAIADHFLKRRLLRGN